MALDTDGNNYVYDIHGSVTSIVNSGGTKSKEYEYNAFGKKESETNKSTENPWQYCGEYYDSDSGLIYLRNRYYDCETGSFINEDPARSGLNWYSYCSGNPVMFVDPLGLYERALAVKYAQMYGTGERNPNYDSYPQETGNCANFVSQCLYSGGISQTKEWKSTAYPKIIQDINKFFAGEGNFYERRNSSQAWTVANEQYKYFSDPKNGYINGDVIVINNSDEYEEALSNKEQQIQEGDLLFWASKENNEKNEVYHSTIIVSADNGELCYAGNTTDRVNANVENTINWNEDKLIVVRIKDDAK